MDPANHKPLWWPVRRRRAPPRAARRSRPRIWSSRRRHQPAPFPAPLLLHRHSPAAAPTHPPIPAPLCTARNAAAPADEGGSWRSEATEQVVVEEEGVGLKACAAAAVSPVFTATRRDALRLRVCLLPHGRFLARLGGNYIAGRGRLFFLSSPADVTAQPPRWFGPKCPPLVQLFPIGRWMSLVGSWDRDCDLCPGHGAREWILLHERTLLNLTKSHAET